jgi:hypothetical protein
MVIVKCFYFIYATQRKERIKKYKCRSIIITVLNSLYCTFRLQSPLEIIMWNQKIIQNQRTDFIDRGKSTTKQINMRIYGQLRGE